MVTSFRIGQYNDYNQTLCSGSALLLLRSLPMSTSAEESTKHLIVTSATYPPPYEQFRITLPRGRNVFHALK